MKKVFVLIGESGSGKSVAQSVLHKLGYRPYHMIGFLYRMVADALGYSDKSDLELWEDDFKRVEIRPGLTVIDYLLQSFHFHDKQGWTIAADYAKNMIPMLLLNEWIDGLAITSVRHPEELEAILQACEASLEPVKVEVVEIRRPGSWGRSSDVKVKRIVDACKNDHTRRFEFTTVHNTGSLEDLKSIIKELVNK